MAKDPWILLFSPVYSALAGASIKQSEAVAEQVYENALFLRPSVAAMMVVQCLKRMPTQKRTWRST